MAAPQAFLDILANAQVRDAYLAGRVALILSSDLETVLWANGAGARFMGFPTVAESLAGQTVFNAITRRLISHALKSGKAVSVRGAKHSEQFLANGINLPPWGDAVFLRSVAAAVDSRGKVDLTEGLSDETSAAALFDLSGQIMYANEDFNPALAADPGLRALLKEAFADGKVKKRVLGGETPCPTGVLLLNKKPPIFLAIAAKHHLGDGAEQIHNVKENHGSGAETENIMHNDDKTNQGNGSNLSLSQQEREAFFAIAERLQRTLQKRSPQEGKTGDEATAEKAGDQTTGTADILAELTVAGGGHGSGGEEFHAGSQAEKQNGETASVPAGGGGQIKRLAEKLRAASEEAGAAPIKVVSLSDRKREALSKAEQHTEKQSEGVEKRERTSADNTQKIREIRQQARGSGAESSVSPSADSGSKEREQFTEHQARQAEQMRHMAAQLQTLSHQNERLSFLLNVVSESVLILDKNGKIVVCNAAAARLFGYEQQDLCAQDLAGLFVPSAAEALQDAVRQAQGQETGSFLQQGHEAEGRTSAGGRLRLRVNFGCLSAGKNYFLLIRDMTRFHDIIAALLRKNADDAKIVQRQSRFAALMSHEMRTPLNAVLGMAEFMFDERAGALDNSKYKEYLGDILRAGNHIMTLVNDVLHLSQNRAEWLNMNIEAIELPVLLNDAVRLIIPQANAANLLVRSGIAEDLPPVLADARSLKQILLNLLSNAVHFTPAEGQIMITAHEASAEQAAAYPGLSDTAAQALQAGKSDRYIALRITDTGIGMSGDEIARALRDPLLPDPESEQSRQEDSVSEEQESTGGETEHYAGAEHADQGDYEAAEAYEEEAMADDAAANEDAYDDYSADADYNALKLRMKGAGLGLPMAYALAEANNIIFSLRSEQGKGTEALLLLPAAETKA